jgi:protocatechuate 4,5-dioxygenase, alpha chain
MDHHIPGTVIYDGREAMKGYALNKMCYSLNEAENRAEYLADEEAYWDRFHLTPAQRDAIASRQVLQMVAAGGNIYYLSKLAGAFGWNVQDIGAQQTGMTVEAFKQKLSAEGA